MEWSPARSCAVPRCSVSETGEDYKPRCEIKKIVTVSSFGFSDGWATTPIYCISKRVAPWRVGCDLATTYFRAVLNYNTINTGEANAGMKFLSYSLSDRRDLLMNIIAFAPSSNPISQSPTVSAYHQFAQANHEPYPSAPFTPQIASPL
jgi:hypothetical protein